MNSKNKVFQQKQQKLIIYTRNTARDQLKKYHAPKTAHALKREYEQAGYTVVKVYSETSLHSSYKARPVLQQMLEDASSGSFEGVVVDGVLTLSSSGEELRQIVKKLTKCNVVLHSFSEQFNTSTANGIKEFEYMCKLINTNDLHMAALQGLSLSQAARWSIEKEHEGGESIAKF